MTKRIGFELPPSEFNAILGRLKKLTQSSILAKASVQTPANITAARLRLGLGVAECAEYLGVKQSFMRMMEGRKINAVYAGVITALDQLEGAVSIYRREVATMSPRVLITYANQFDFQKHDAIAYSTLRMVQVHRMAVAQAQVDMAFAKNILVPIVTFDPDDYSAFADGRNDCSQLREEWAMDFAERYITRQGLPHPPAPALSDASG